MRINVLPRRTRKRHQQPERVVLTTVVPPSSTSPSSPSSPSSPVEPAEPATPTSPVLTATTSDDGHSLKRRTSTFRTIERQFSNLSLRSSFSRIRRPRSPPPPYSLEEPAVAPAVAVAVAPVQTTAAAVVVQTVDTQEAAATTVVAVATSTSTPGKATEDVDAIAVVKETPGPSLDSKTVAKVDIRTAPEINSGNTQHSSSTATDIKADLKANHNQKAEDAAEELLLDVAAAPLEDLPLPSARDAAKFRRLAQPVVVPRLHGGVTVPFARGYAPCLGDTHGIDAATFLAFIDGLNLVTSPHPAAMALSAVAFSMQFVPHDYANAVGGVAQLLAEVTTAVVAHKRGKMFLARANVTLFEPRGLHVSIAKTKRMRAVLGIAPKAPLLAPLTEETVELATLERCMHHLNDNGWAASLELEACTGTLMPMARPTYREALTSTDITATWHPDYDAEKKKLEAVEEEGADWDPPALKRASSTWTTMGRTVSHGLAIVADKRVRTDIKKAEREASRARRRALKRHHKGKKLKEPFGEKYRVGHLSWILVRNLDDVRREEAEIAAAKAAKKAPKKAPAKTGKATGPVRRSRIEVV